MLSKMGQVPACIYEPGVMSVAEAPACLAREYIEYLSGPDHIIVASEDAIHSFPLQVTKCFAETYMTLEPVSS